MCNTANLRKYRKFQNYIQGRNQEQKEAALSREHLTNECCPSFYYGFINTT